MKNTQKTEILSLYNELSSQLSSNYNNIEDKIPYKQEISILKQMYEQLEWDDLSDEAKQDKRKSILVTLDKWSYEEGVRSESTYEKNVIELYDEISNVLSKNLSNDLYTKRIKSIIFIEKIFIDEKKVISNIRHMDYFIWTQLFESTASNIPDLYRSLDLHILNDRFMRMYKSWPKRPYKEV